MLAIALGVALGYAVQLITQSAVNELALGVQVLSGEADLQVRGPRNGFDEALYPELSRLPEVAVTSPIVEVDARLADRGEALRIVGLDVFRAGAVQPGLVAEAGDRLDLLRPDLLFLSPAAARWLDVEAGGSLRFVVALREVPLSIGGFVRSDARQRFAVMDIAGAQASFDRLGVLTRIDLRLKPGVDVDAFRERLQALLPAGLTAERPQASLAAAASMSRSYRVNLDVLALVALFTGWLLVFSTQVLSVVRRRAHFALLRVLASRGEGWWGCSSPRAPCSESPAARSGSSADSSSRRSPCASSAPISAPATFAASLRPWSSHRGPCCCASVSASQWRSSAA